MPDYNGIADDPQATGDAKAPRRAGLLSRWLAPKPAKQTASRSYRYLARQLEVDLPSADGGRTVLLTSPAEPELGNEFSLMVGYFLSAELGCRVLIIDGTLNDDGVGSALGHAGAPGLMDIAYGATYAVADLIQPTQHSNVSILPAGRTGVSHMLPMVPATIASLFAAVRSRYDYILVQQGPIFLDSRYLQFTSKCDIILMLVEEDGTSVEELERCLTVFRSHQVANVHIVLSTPR